MTVAKMLQWGFPAQIDDAATRTSETSIGDHEKNIYTVEGSLWRLVLEGNDCDLHLELAGVGKGKLANRVIVEIPQANTTARNDLVAGLTQSDRDKLLHHQPNSSITLSHPIKLRVTGYGFYDTYHYSTNWQSSTPHAPCNFSKAAVHKRGNKHGSCAVGTIWELHPVWKVEVLP